MYTISKKFYYLFISVALFSFACEENDNPEPAVVETETASDVAADPDSEGAFTYFSFENGVVSGDETSMDWDIALSGTTILTNGGNSGAGNAEAQIITGVFENINEAPEAGYFVDTEESPAIQGSDGADESRPGWYSYTGQAPSGPQHAILAIPGRVIVLKTAAGNYAKMEIISYYEGNPDTTTPEFADLGTRPASRYYTFKYAVQTDGSRSF